MCASACLCVRLIAGSRACVVVCVVDCVRVLSAGVCVCVFGLCEWVCEYVCLCLVVVWCVLVVVMCVCVVWLCV